MSSGIDKLIAKKIESSATFAKEYKKESQRLDVALALTNLRHELGLSQRALADKVGKPQSTIARIENGSMNVSFNLLVEITDKVDKEVHIEFR